MDSFQRLESRLRTGGPVILDGANGTELERLGVRMDQDLWCARALADCPAMVHQVHRRYISRYSVRCRVECRLPEIVDSRLAQESTDCSPDVRNHPGPE